MSFLVLNLVFTINNAAEKKMVLIVASFTFSPFLFTFLYFHSAQGFDEKPPDNFNRLEFICI